MNHKVYGSILMTMAFGTTTALVIAFFMNFNSRDLAGWDIWMGLSALLLIGATIFASKLVANGNMFIIALIGYALVGMETLFASSRFVDDIGGDGHIVMWFAWLATLAGTYIATAILLGMLDSDLNHSGDGSSSSGEDSSSTEHEPSAQTPDDFPVEPETAEGATVHELQQPTGT